MGDYMLVNATMAVSEQEIDKWHVMDFHLDSVACTPEVGPGDLILFRDDTVHRTQAHRSRRTSLNVNVHPSTRFLDMKTTLTGGMTKYNYMYMSPFQYVGLYGHIPERQKWLYERIQ